METRGSGRFGRGTPGGIALRAGPQPPQAVRPRPLGGWGPAGSAGAAPRSAAETKMFTAVVGRPAPNKPDRTSYRPLRLGRAEDSSVRFSGVLRITRYEVETEDSVRPRKDPPRKPGRTINAKHPTRRMA